LLSGQKRRFGPTRIVALGLLHQYPDRNRVAIIASMHVPESKDNA